MMGYGAAFGFGWIGMIVDLLFWVGVIVLVVWGAMHLFPSRQAAGQDTALDILRRRYAGGEISAAEYDKAKKDLT